MFREPICLNCEKKRSTPYPITLDQKSGYICEECYNANIWAKELDINTKTEKELHLYLIQRLSKRKKGQPKINQDILVGLITKIKMNKKITPYKAWIKATEEENFTWILEQHYKNKKGNADWWITRFKNEPDTKRTFWRNHLQAHF